MMNALMTSTSGQVVELRKDMVRGVGMSLWDLMDWGFFGLGGKVIHDIGDTSATSIDPKTGEQKPTVIGSAVKEVSHGISSAMTLAVVIGLGYLIFSIESRRRR